MNSKKKTAAKASRARETKKIAPDPYAPSLTVLVALGSLAVHVEEIVETLGGFDSFQAKLAIFADKTAPFDLPAVKQILEDQPEVRAWLSAMDAKALLPKKR